MTHGQYGPTNHLQGQERLEKLQSIVKGINEEIVKLRDRKYICMTEISFIIYIVPELFDRYPDYNCRWACKWMDCKGCKHEERD